jgi:CubicO group peptidase (beta-lactamase class C family)
LSTAHDPNIATVPGLASGGRRALLHRTRLLALRADARERRHAQRRPHPRAGKRRADAQESSSRFAQRQSLRRRPPSDASGVWIRYDVAVFDDPQAAASAAGKGTFFWDGAAGTWFWIDPTNDIVFVGMIQRMLTSALPDLQEPSRSLVEKAVIGR